MKHRIKHGFVCLLALCVCLMSGCIFPERPYIEDCKYNKYVCFDANLRSLKSEDSGLCKSSYEKNGSSYTMWYEPISGESEELFIVAHWVMIFVTGSNAVRVRQNPERYVDIWNEWQVEKVLVYIDDGAEPVWDRTDQGDLDDMVLPITFTDPAIFEDIRTLATDKSAPLLDLPDEYTRYFTRGYDVNMIVMFQNSENIVWNVEIECYEIDGVKRFALRCREMYDDRDVETYLRSVEVPEDSALYTALSPLIDKYLYYVERFEKSLQ